MHAAAMGLKDLPPELTRDIVDRLSPPSLDWDEYHSQTKWLLNLRLVSKHYDSIVIGWFLSAIKANREFDDIPLMRGVATPSIKQMCIRLLTEEVFRSQGGSMFGMVRTVIWGAGMAAELLQDGRTDISLLRKCYMHGLISTVVGLMGPYTLLAHLSGEDFGNKEFGLDDRQNVALVAAAGLGRLSDMRQLVKLGADVNFDKEDGWLGSPYNAASYGGHIDAIKFLLDQGVDPKKKSLGNEESALHFAAAAGHDHVVRFLLDHQVEVDSRDSDKATPVLCAAAAGHSETTTLLLDHSADSNVQDRHKETPLLWATWRGHVGVIETLLGRDEINVECTDGGVNNMTPLAVAALTGREDVIDILLAQPNINIHAKDDQDYTILKHAVVGGNEAIVKTVLGLPGIDVNAVGDEGTTPLMWAAREGNETLVRLLLSHSDIDVNIQADQGLTALTFATTSENPDVVKSLLERQDIDPDLAHEFSEEMEGMSLLGLLSATGNEEMARLLLQHSRTTPDIIDMYERTPLMVAAINDHICIIKLLLARDDVDINTTDVDGYTALMHAAQSGNEAAVGALLESPDILVGLSSHSEETALDLAVQEGHLSTVKLLLGREMRGFVQKNVEDAMKLSRRLQQEEIRAFLSHHLGLMSATILE